MSRPGQNSQVSFVVTRSGTDLAWLLLLAVSLMVFCIWLTNNHFSHETALRDWVKVLGVVEADDFHIEHLGFDRPHIPLYLLMPLTWLPDNSQGAAPCLLSSLLVALLLTVWNQQLRHKKLGFWQRSLLIVLVIAQAPLLWAATTGGHLALSLLIYYFIYRACLRMSFHADLRSFIMLAMLLALLFFVDAGALFIFAALFPFFAIIAPRRIFLESPLSVYIVIGMPLVVAVLSWAYLGWIFEGNAANFLFQPDSAFLGGWQNTPESSWLSRYGGQWLAPLGIAIIMLAGYYPVSFLLLVLAARHKHHIKASLVLLLAPVIAVAFATSKYFLERPVEMLTLVLAGIMAELTVVQFRKGWKFTAVVLLLALGALSGWDNFMKVQDPLIQDWRQALSGELENTHAEDMMLGRFLSQHHDGKTLIDDITAYRAIVARGNAEQMALPGSDEFKLQVRKRIPDIDYIVVPDPRVGRGGWDRINKHFPRLYNEGMVNYQRIYNQQGWRVFKHVSAQ